MSVPALVLDERCADLDRLDLLKIDIEGMEPLALRGLEREGEGEQPTQGDLLRAPSGRDDSSPV